MTDMKDGVEVVVSFTAKQLAVVVGLIVGSVSFALMIDHYFAKQEDLKSLERRVIDSWNGIDPKAVKPPEKGQSLGTQIQQDSSR